MNIKSAIFKCSSQKISQLPTDMKEIAFIGRSNVGKSSLINMLTDKPALAKVSSTPGKTKLVNHFTINDEWYLVDLPGYGYARASKTTREKFAKLITNYLTKSERLHYLFVLLDIRHEPQKIDMEFITMLGEEGVPFGLIFTKADKLTPNQCQSSVARYKRALKEEWEELPPIFISSAEKKTGRDEILSYCDEILVIE